MVNVTARCSDDYVIATGKQYSVRNFVEIACQVLGIEITWEGKDK